jgi:hypothetical protein
VGDVFYKDGNNYVVTYNPATVDLLLLSATTARKAAFSFISRSEYDILLTPQQNASRAAPSTENHAANPSLRFHAVQQTWDFEHPCIHCGCIYLVSESAQFRLKCCKDGTLLASTTFPHLFSLPPQLEYLAVKKINHMTNSSSYYNGALQLGN